MLCIGDSLTEGFCNGGFSRNPFTFKLQDCFNTLLGKPNKMKVYNYGFSGIHTSDLKNHLLPNLPFESSSKSIPIKYATLLIGMNDVGMISKSFDIQINIWKQHLSDLINMISNHFEITQLFIMTLPRCELDTYEENINYIKTKTKMNNLLRKLIKLHQKRKKQNGLQLILIDLEHISELNYVLQEDEKRQEIWDDHIHYSEIGYNLLGEHIFNHWLKYNNKQQNNTNYIKDYNTNHNKDQIKMTTTIKTNENTTKQQQPVETKEKEEEL